MAIWADYSGAQKVSGQSRTHMQKTYPPRQPTQTSFLHNTPNMASKNHPILSELLSNHRFAYKLNPALVSSILTSLQEGKDLTQILCKTSILQTTIYYKRDK